MIQKLTAGKPFYTRLVFHFKKIPQRKNERPCNFFLPVLLLAALDSNLSQSQSDEESKVPCHHVQPECVIESWSLWEVCQVGTNRLCKEAKQGLSSKGRHPNVGWNEPSSRSNHQCKWLLLKPFVSLVRGSTDDHLPGRHSASGQRGCPQSYTPPRSV